MIPVIDQNSLENMVIYQDDQLLAINKPAGILSVPGGYSPNIPDLKGLLEPIFGNLWIIHRLDKETSGLVLLARSAETHRQLNIQFDNRIISKEYRAIIYGVPDWTELSIEKPLQVNGDRNHRTIISAKGKPAFTDLKVLHRFPCFTYLAIYPHTGLTHQIRAHLAYTAHPILLDMLYGKGFVLPQDAKLITRIALHAFQIQFNHPTSGNLTVLSAPLPPDLRYALDSLPQIRTHAEEDLNAIYNTVTHQVLINKTKKH